MCDQVFGRRNFIADVTWQKKHAPGNNEKGISSDSDHLLVWAKDANEWQWNLLPRTDKQDSLYKNPDNDPRGAWQADNLTRAEHRDRDYYAIRTPSGRDVFPPAGRSWSRPPDEIERLRADNRLWFGPKGNAGPRLKRFLSEVQGGVVARTVWLREEVGSNDEAKKEAKTFNDKDIFATPKPERLIHRIVHIATNPGDWVLDSFAGSGTTGAVAHKMGRRWIMVELGDHCHTHVIPRLKKVIDGDDPGGVTEAVGWQGGGGFRYYKLGVPVFDQDGHIDERIKFEHLAAHVWFAETGTARSTRAKKDAFLGEHGGTGYYLLFNGILGDERKTSGNVLTRRVLRSLPKFDGPKVIYGEACDLSAEQLRELDIAFRQTPYDIRAR